MINYNTVLLANKALYRTDVTTNMPIRHMNTDVWIKISEFCSFNTWLSLRKVNKQLNGVFSNLIINKLYKDQNEPSEVYSISSYKNFIAPIIENFAPINKLEIDEYLALVQENIELNKYFPKFLYYKLFLAKKNLHRTGSIIKYLQLPFKINSITVSELSNHFAITCRRGHVYIYEFSGMNFKQVICFTPNKKNNCAIFYIKFSPKNNLLIQTNDNTLALWKLNLNDDTNINKTERLWRLQLSYIINKLVMFKDEKNFIANFYRRKSLEDKCYFFSIKDDTFYESKPINKVLNLKVRLNKYESNIELPWIIDLAISRNNISLAIASSKDMYGYNSTGISLFTVDCYENRYTFLKKTLPIRNIGNYNENFFSYNNSLQINSTGNICVFTNLHNDIILLSKVNDIWYSIFSLRESHYYSVHLTCDNKNLIYIREWKDLNGERKRNCELMSLADIKLIGLNMPIYEPKHSTSIADYINFYPWEKDTKDYKFSIHPTGLSTISYEQDSNIIKLIFPRKISVLEDIKNRGLFYLKRYMIGPPISR